MLCDAFQPALDVPERFFICNVKDDYDTLGLLVKRLGQCSKSFLTSSVPNLDLEIFVREVFWLEVLSHEVEPKCGHMRGSELLLCVHLDH